MDVALTRIYHCISRCERRAIRRVGGGTHSNAWIEARLELLAKRFAVLVCGCAILDNYVHALSRLDPGIADGWSDEDFVRRCITVYRPPETAKGQVASAKAQGNEEIGQA